MTWNTLYSWESSCWTFQCSNAYESSGGKSNYTFNLWWMNPDSTGKLLHIRKGFETRGMLAASLGQEWLKNLVPAFSLKNQRLINQDKLSANPWLSAVKIYERGQKGCHSVLEWKGRVDFRDRCDSICCLAPGIRRNMWQISTHNKSIPGRCL